MLAQVPAQAAESEEKRRAAELQALRERMQQIEQSLQQSVAEKNREQRVLRQVEVRLGQAQSALHRLERQENQLQSQLVQLERQQHALRIDVDRQRGLLAEQLRAAFIMGRQQRVKLLLNQEQPQRVSRMLTYYEYFNQARVQQMDDLNAALRELGALETELAQQRANLQLVVLEKQTEALKLEAARTSRAKVVAQLSQSIQATGSALQQLQADEKRLQDLLVSIRQAINDLPMSNLDSKPFAELKGQLPWPIKGQLVNRFGSQRQTGRWDGVLIDAREGQPIRAISHGRVVFADWLRGYGLLAIIDHGAGFMSLYAFNQSLYKEVGDWVHAGEEIAAAGASGGRDQAGLYFGIRKQGKPVDPADWCRASQKGQVG